MAIRLNYFLSKATSQSTGQNLSLIISHGLFGFSQNWRSLAKRFSNELSADVYSLDMRNHGQSPHVDEMSLSSMAEDVKLFLSEHQLQNAFLLGHSMVDDSQREVSS